MNPSEKIYRDAAERIADGSRRHCCPAIWRAKNICLNDSCLEKDLFAPLFKTSRSRGVIWFGPYEKPENQNHRITTLLLMAEMARTGDL